MDKVRAQKAVNTASEYHQGNIANLDDAMTRRLVASTVFTESNGGNLSITNAQGYVGRYQAGASWLAEAGLIKGGDGAVIAAMKKDGYTNEWKWATSGHMTKFLQDPSHWNNGMSLDKYKHSAEVQDTAFKTICDKAYKRGMAEGVLHANDSPEHIAGFLKARHIAGYGGAVKAISHGAEVRDANGTSNRDYYNDIARNRDGLNAYMKNVTPSVAQQPHNEQQTPASKKTAPVETAHSTHAPMPHKEAPHYIKQGDHGASVRALQLSLATHGESLHIDGKFGPETEKALKHYQGTHGL
ncbi:MAG: peptidoglycan-binding domain-containing protein, partial [Formosimonas sp.]